MLERGTLPLAAMGAVLSLCLGSVALAQGTTAPGSTAAGPTTGSGPSSGPAKTPIVVEKDIDLPINKPILKTPPKPPTPPQPPVPPPTTPPTIYGKNLKSENGTIVYVLDVSGSMGWDTAQYTTPDGKKASGNRLDRAKAELTRSILSLPSNFKLNIIAFDCDIYQWNGGLVQADDKGKNGAIAWVNGLEPLGATGTGPAGVSGLSIKENKLVVLLTDGAPNCGAGDESGSSTCMMAHRLMIRGANTQGAVMNVFGIGATSEFKQFCLDVASDNGGTYTDVR